MYVEGICSICKTDFRALFAFAWLDFLSDNSSIALFPSFSKVIPLWVHSNLMAIFCPIYYCMPLLLCSSKCIVYSEKNSKEIEEQGEKIGMPSFWYNAFSNCLLCNFSTSAERRSRMQNVERWTRTTLREIGLWENRCWLLILKVRMGVGTHPVSSFIRWKDMA